MSDFEHKQPDEPVLPDAAPEEPETHYTPRPKWQVVLAWVLLIIVVLGVINICYWQIFR